MHACMDYQRRPVAIAADDVDQLGRRQPRQLGFRRHRVEAARLAVSFRPLAALDQEQETTLGAPA